MSCDSDSGPAGPARKMKPYSREDEDLDHVSESNYDSSDGHKSMQLKPCNLSVSGGDASDNEADQPTRRSEIKLEALLELNVGLNLISKPHSNDDNNNASYATTSNNNVNDSNNNNQQIKCENSKQGGRKLFECDVCNMKFSNGANMRRHKMRHTGVKPYECRVCQKRFFRKDHLAEHFTTHTKTLPYHCPICNRGFQRQIAMRAHFQNEHVGQHEMVKTCPLCSYRAGTMKSLRVHFFNRHGIDLDNPGSGTSSSLLLALEQSNSTHLLPALAAAAAASGSNNINNNSNNNYSDSGESARSTENATPPMHFLTPHVEISMTDNDNPVRMNSESNSQSQSASVTATTSSGLDIHAIVRPHQKGSPASPQSADSNSNIPSSSHSSILANAVSSRHHMFENSITPSISLIPIKQEPNTNDGYSSDSNSKSNQRSLTSTPMLCEPSQGPLNNNVSNSTAAESVTPTSSLASMIKVSPLKSLLREDLKRRITARANNRVARNLNSLATQLSSSSSSSVCNSSNTLSTLTVMPEAPVVATSTNGTITSTGADNEMMAASSSKRKNLQCLYCGIEFPDQTLYFLHKGCHSDTNPWKCNICGDVCQNVYEFNSHLLSKSHQ